jgi:hypothetical protein
MGDDKDEEDSLLAEMLETIDLGVDHYEYVNPGLGPYLRSERFLGLLAELTAQLDPETREDLARLGAVGELVVAVENLCEVLCEDGTVLSGKARGSLTSLILELGVDRKYIDQLWGVRDE